MPITHLHVELCTEFSGRFDARDGLVDLSGGSAGTSSFAGMVKPLDSKDEGGSCICQAMDLRSNQRRRLGKSMQRNVYQPVRTRSTTHLVSSLMPS
jgi:hypothetical protein